MGVGRLFSSTMEVLKRSLDVRLAKHSLTTSNIANTEVPGYKFKDISFSDAMKSAADGPGLPVLRTNARHLTPQAGESAPLICESKQDIEHEMAKLAENNLMYQASVQLLAKKFETIKTVLSEGGK